MIYIVILAFNEEHGIVPLLTDLNASLRSQPRPFRFIVVNDGSVDRTQEVVTELAKTVPITLLRHERNLGVGRAFNTGLRHAAGVASPADVIVSMEGDRTNTPETLIAMLDKMDEGFDVVCASRYRSGGEYVGFPLKRYFFSLCANWTMRLFFSVPGIRDYTIFFRAYRAQVLTKTISAFGEEFIRCGGFTANAEILFNAAQVQSLRCAEVPMIYRYDLKKGKSKMKVARNIREYGSLFRRMLVRRFKNILPSEKHPNRV